MLYFFLRLSMHFPILGFFFPRLCECVFPQVALYCFIHGENLNVELTAPLGLGKRGSKIESLFWFYSPKSFILLFESTVFHIKIWKCTKHYYIKSECFVLTFQDTIVFSVLRLYHYNL